MLTIVCPHVLEAGTLSRSIWGIKLGTICISYAHLTPNLFYTVDGLSDIVGRLWCSIISISNHMRYTSISLCTLQLVVITEIISVGIVQILCSEWFCVKAWVLDPIIACRTSSISLT